MKKTNLENWICEIEALPEINREGLEALQLKRLNETLARLKQRGGRYRDYPKRLESMKELQTLPFTTPQMLSEAPGGFLLTSQSEVSRVISGTTSGTTGQAKRVFYTQQDTDRTVGFFAAGISEMLNAGEKCLIAFPFTGPFGLGDLIAKAVEQLGSVPIRAGFGQTWGELCSLVQQTHPKGYIGFPVPLLSLARLCGTDFPIRRALVSGDACPAGLMAQLEQVLGSKPYPHYGSRECGLGGAVTCSALDGMHIRENHIIPEIIDSAGNVLPDGAYGELVISTIGQEAMPLLRYRTGDYTRILPPCPCCGVTRRIDRVSRKEGPVSMEKLDNLLFCVPELVDYQASHQDTLFLEAKVLRPGCESKLLALAKTLYPEMDIRIHTSSALLSDRPMYLGKRHILHIEQHPGTLKCPLSSRQ